MAEMLWTASNNGHWQSHTVSTELSFYDGNLISTVLTERLFDCFNWAFRAVFVVVFSQYLWPPCVADADIILLSCFFLSAFFSSPNLNRRRMDVYHTSTPGVEVPYCEFRMQVWNVRREARCKCRTQKSPKIRHLGTIAQLCRAISSQQMHLLTIGKSC